MPQLKGTVNFYLKLLIYQKPRETPLVDIWYGTDNQMEKKVYPDMKEVFYIWNPIQNVIRKIGNEKLEKVININSDRYFLAFDIHKFQDYIHRDIKVQIHVYDRQQNTYTVMDTVFASLYVSPDARFAVYRKDNLWKLYDFSSKNKFEFAGPENGKPYFTSDEKAILFDGKDGLWRYDLNQKILL